MKPKKLRINKNLSFQGVKPNGKGFVLSFEEAERIIKKNPKNKECLKIFMVGKDLNQGWTWSGSRMIIDFQDWLLEKALEYKECFEIVKTKVKPQRLKSINQTNDQLRKYWWQFAASGTFIRTHMKSIKHFIVSSQTSKYRFFMMIQNQNIIFSNLCIVIASDSFSFMGILSSKLHIVWTKYQGSTLKADLRYTNTTCFETFPFPKIFYET